MQLVLVAPRSIDAPQHASVLVHVVGNVTQDRQSEICLLQQNIIDSQQLLAGRRNKRV